MIKTTQDTNDFLLICDKLKCIKDTFLKQDSLYSLLIGSIYSNDVNVFVSNDGKKMNGCMVFIIQHNLNLEKILLGVLLWIDPRYPKLIMEFMKKAENLARDNDINKIMFSTRRNPDAVIRKFGRYGFKKAYHVIEKELI